MTIPTASALLERALRDCPFCDGPARMYSDDYVGDSKDPWASVDCTNPECEAQGPCVKRAIRAEAEREAVGLWNRRAPSPAASPQAQEAMDHEDGAAMVGPPADVDEVLRLLAATPVAVLHDDGYWTFTDHGKSLHQHPSHYAGWRLEVYDSPPPAAVPQGTRWQHVKTGRVYVEVCRAYSVADHETPVVVYRSEADGHIWTRPEREFEDGRFVELAAAPESAPAGSGNAAAAVPSALAVALDDIEQYRMQMAGISTAALGYWTESESVHPDYDTPALRDVAKLYAKYSALHKAASITEPLAWAALKNDRVFVCVRSKERADAWAEKGLEMIPLYASPAPPAAVPQGTESVCTLVVTPDGCMETYLTEASNALAPGEYRLYVAASPSPPLSAQNTGDTK